MRDPRVWSIAGRALVSITSNATAARHRGTVSDSQPSLSDAEYLQARRIPKRQEELLMRMDAGVPWSGWVV